ncbi:hypothetical protein SLS62_010720, partial [Diatrype stigma]
WIIQTPGSVTRSRHARHPLFSNGAAVSLYRNSIVVSRSTGCVPSSCRSITSADQAPGPLPASLWGVMAVSSRITR